MKTLTFAVGAAVGYVLGTKAGREKYQQIVDGVNTVGKQPAVQQARSNIKNLIGQGTATLNNKLGGSDGVTTTLPDTGTTAAATTVRTTPKKANGTTPAPVVDTSF